MIFGKLLNATQQSAGALNPAGGAGALNPASGAGALNPVSGAGALNPAGGAGALNSVSGAGALNPAGVAGDSSTQKMAGSDQSTAGTRLEITNIWNGPIIIMTSERQMELEKHYLTYNSMISAESFEAIFRGHSVDEI